MPVMFVGAEHYDDHLLHSCLYNDWKVMQCLSVYYSL